MNLSNPKGESFDVEEEIVTLWTCQNRLCKGREIESRKFERKIGGRLFSMYYSGIFQFIKSGSGFDSFFSLIIHIQMGKLHFGSHGKNEESKRKENLLTYKKL